MENLGFGLYLKSLRKEKHFTLKELAEKSGTSDSYLSQVETGKRNPPKPSFLEKLSNAIGGK
jgi:transcriptional regulator with XRE-family HTH domain